MASAIQIVTNAASAMTGGSGSGNNSGFGGRGTEKTLGQQLKKMAGIDLGIGALLKQSQIFTGYLGNIFAIVGALIDTILAPSAPIAFKALADIGKKWLPAAQKFFAKNIPKVVSFLGTIVKGIDSIGKFINKDWAKYMGLSLAALIGIKIAVSAATMTGGMARSAIGLRGGYLSKGIGMLRGGGGGMSTFARGAGTSASPIAMKGAQGAGRLARFGGVGRVVGGGAGGAIGGLTGYMGGRAQGMSQGQSVGRGVAGGAGGAAGAVLGSALGPAGTMIGGMAGSALSTMLFDKMFGGNDKKGGGRTDEMGQLGLAGYSAPMVVASAAKKFSDVVENSTVILANSVLKHATSSENAGKKLVQNAEEHTEMMKNEELELNAFRNQVRTEFATRLKVISSAGKVGDLSFARGAGAGAVRSTATAMDFQAKQIVNEIKHELIDSKTYGIASSLGFSKDSTVTQTAGGIRIHQAGSGMAGDGPKEIDLNITFGGADGSQQILRGEQNGKQIFIKMEEDVSGYM